MGDTNRTTDTPRRGGRGKGLIHARALPHQMFEEGVGTKLLNKKKHRCHKAQKRGTKDLRSRMKPLLGVGINRVDKRTKQESGIQGGDGKEYVYG